MARIVQGTVCKILARQEVKPNQVRYFLERRDEAFETKMGDLLWIYREVAVLRESQDESRAAIISRDERPGIQAIGNTEPDLAPGSISLRVFLQNGALDASPHQGRFQG